MKYLIIVFVLTFSTTSYCQKDTLPVFTMGFNISFTDSNFNEIFYSLNDGSITIYGDTIKAIKQLIKFYTTKDSTINALRKFINAGIAFANEVPDYWRTNAGNCKWPNYLYYLKKNGYRVTKGKSKNTCK